MTEHEILSGEIILGTDVRPFSGAAVYVRLEETSRLDAPARVIEEQIIFPVTHQAGRQTRLEFSLRCNNLDSQAQYNVRAHVDVDGDRSVSVGDYITMQSYPVLTFGYPSHVSIHVREVR